MLLMYQTVVSYQDNGRRAVRMFCPRNQIRPRKILCRFVYFASKCKNKEGFSAVEPATSAFSMDKDLAYKYVDINAT